ncbi:ferredoxin-NADP reductase [Aurantimicrobium minutum]|uniref:PDR/VanB family oxidoreductase n=1 Tax=Aurantimicrobium minutum TaxID=708131 RepID=UPI0024763654|nr:PDR/VanB family oxidoreductase [Aurantimicrobium minutum]MDH6278210.1 ferredoxin-NADP reductase [Aurantimicrobium minutum]
MNYFSTHEETMQLLRIVNRVTPAKGVVELEFVRADGGVLPQWAPGAHIDLKLDNSVTRQYSLMKGLLEPTNWRIAVLIEEFGRGGSLFISKSVQMDTELVSVGPRNHFPLVRAENYLFIAGGIGITPIVPMLELAEEEGIPWKLAYLGKSLETMAYASDLLSAYGEKVQLYPKDQGKTYDLEKSIATVSENTHVYSCGPERLITALENSMVENLNNLHVERFHPREIVLTEPNSEFTVYCKKSDVELLVPADESILMAADFEGIDIPGDCMEGTCGSCETRVIEGEVDHRDSVLSAQARAEGDTMMICISRAKGNRLVIDL